MQSNSNDDSDDDENNNAKRQRHNPSLGEVVVKSETAVEGGNATKEMDLNMEENAVESSSQEMPVAPRLDDYMAPGGTTRFRPRPEWYRGFDELQSYRASMSASRRNAAAAQSSGQNSTTTATRGHHHHHHHGQQRRHRNNDGHHRHRNGRNNNDDVDDDDDDDETDDVQEHNNQRHHNGGVARRPQHEAIRAPPVAAALAADQPRVRQHNGVPQHDDGDEDNEGDQNGNDDDNDENDSSAAIVESDEDIADEDTNDHASAAVASSESIKPSSKGGSISNNRPPPPSTFGKDFDPALHMAIRCNATKAALSLLSFGAPVDSENVKGVTPLILAAQMGSLELVQELLRRGASPSSTSSNGATAVLQAAHFGHVHILETLLLAGGVRLMELANLNHTTPLMRAAQEGHVNVVRYLLEQGALVNRRNCVQMTALMLAAQRGHAEIAQLLIDYGADLDAITCQESTSLLLACKRSHIDVVRVLVRAGCELWIRDARGRTAREIARRRHIKEMVYMLDPLVQIDIMRREARRQRSVALVRMWTLLQKERANIPVELSHFKTIHELSPMLERHDLPYHLSQSTTLALFRIMALPSSLFRIIVEFAPCPTIWNKRIGLLTKRCLVNADAAVACGLDLVDEIIEEGGFLEACDIAKIEAPSDFESWKEWKRWCRRHAHVVGSQPEERVRPNATLATVHGPADPSRPSLVELRREVGYLRLLSNSALSQALTSPPYNIPPLIIRQLTNISDIQSLVRRMSSRGVHLDPPVAMDIIMLTSRLCSWYSRERENPITNYCG